MRRVDEQKFRDVSRARTADVWFISQLDPLTNTVKPGVLQAHYDMQKLATFDITKNVPKSL